jgi:uncharacterized membrane-anchored protein
MRHLPIVLVLLVQTAIVASVPARQVAARISGTPITLRTRPVDPFSLLSGYYVTLAFEAEWPAEELVEKGLESEERVWLTVERAEPAWVAVSVTRNRPPAREGRVSLRARWIGPSLRIEGADRFYIAESRREEVERERLTSREQALVDMKVGRDGTPALLRLRVGPLLLDPR